MKRRGFFDVMAASALAFPTIGTANPPGAVRRIGTLTTEAPESQAEQERRYAPLRALGWVEGRNLVVERRFAEGNDERLRRFAEEFTQLPVELIGAVGTPAGLAAKRATSTIPIVIWGAADVVRTGLVASFSRPGGNVTGFSYLGFELEVKGVEFLRELVPGLRRIGVLDTANPYARDRRRDLERSLTSLNLETFFFEAPLERT